MNMIHWLKDAPKQRKAMPVLSFPGIQWLGISVHELVHSPALQARCMLEVAQRYDMLASVSFMDLSVEAEAFGSPIRFSAEEVPTVTAPIVSDQDEADALAIPKVGAKRTGLYLQAMEQAAALITDRPIFAGTIGPFSLAGRLNDMTEIMMNCIAEPELVHTLLKKATTFIIEYILAFKKAGANGVVLAEPAAGLLSPALIAEFSVPYVRQICEAVEDDSFLLIYHNCGKILPLLDEILKIGAKALHFGNAIRLKDTLERIPSGIVVMGNVDPAGVLRAGSPETVRSATLALLNDCAAYPNFVLSSGCDIPPMTAMENIAAFFAANDDFVKGVTP